ncbi:MAG: hypothetical protein FWH48_01555 [Oscillospiraceae bacterium]|nr:hypothetical protein [Oscillospiraceae bacterium]
MKAKILTSSIVLIVLCAVALFSCAEKEVPALELDLQNLAEAIGEKIDLSESIERSEQFYNECGIDAGDTTQMIALKKIDIANVGNAEVLLLIEATDEQKAADIEGKLKVYKTNKLNELSNYQINPDYERQWYIVDESEIMLEKQYVFWAVDAQGEEINAIIRDYIKSKK